MGLFDEASLREYLGVPGDEDIVVVIALGKKDKDPRVPPKEEINSILKVF
jgi:hypothetical protein